MTPPGFFRSCFLVVVLMAGIGLPLFSLSAEENPGEAQVAATTSKEQEATLIQIYSWATILPKELIDLQTRLAKEKSSKAVEKELAVLQKEAETLKRNMASDGASSELQLMNTKSYKTKSFKISSRLKRLSEPITSTITYLSTQRKEWQSKKDQISGYDNKEVLSLALAEKQQEILIETVEKALEFIMEQLAQVLAVGKKIGDFQIQLYSDDAELKGMVAELRAAALQKTSSSILSKKFYTRINLNQLLQSYSNTRRFVDNQMENLENDRDLIVLVFFVCFLVYLGVNKSKGSITAASRWYPFALYPLATTIFLASSLNAFLDMMPIDLDLPLQWEALLYIMTMLAAIRLTTQLIEKKLHQRLLIRLIMFMAIAMIMILLDLPQVLILLFVFYASIVALVYYFYQLPSFRGKTGFTPWFLRTLGIFPAAVILFGISGYDQVAVILFSSLLSAVIASLIVWILYRLHIGFFDFILSALPSAMFRDNREVILKSMQPIIICLHTIFLIGIQAVVWGIYPNVHAAFTGIFISGFEIANFQISPGFFLTIFFFVYGALLVSKAIQMILLNRVLPRYGAERGVQLAITRLTHYGILTVGFLVMLNVLGFRLNQLALLGGALGVGIGFGLQAIVNNFTSGLILLFERPIKVGDTIQVGTEIGEVKNLGLRATVIQTFDNAEIVVPNSDLVTLQVTNWTLGERKARIRVPVGVAYGTEVAKVLEILLVCGNANPMVLTTPPATSFFLAFGASSLDFELRVWIPEYLDRVKVLSDLNQDIENEFSMNNIEIPFPQTDLHLRSVDEAVASNVWGASAPTQPSEPAKKRTETDEREVPETNPESA
jgi:potassium efflux system protein